MALEILFYSLAEHNETVLNKLNTCRQANLKNNKEIKKQRYKTEQVIKGFNGT